MNGTMKEVARNQEGACGVVRTDETRLSAGVEKGDNGLQQTETQKGRMVRELRSALTLLVQCELATKELIERSDTFVADVMDEFLGRIERHKDAMSELLEVYK